MVAKLQVRRGDETCFQMIKNRFDQLVQYCLENWAQPDKPLPMQMVIEPLIECTGSAQQSKGADRGVDFCF
jgi:hypothetical protein